MTSPALLVLSLFLVCSVFGMITVHTGHDNNSKQKNIVNNTLIKEVNMRNLTMETLRTKTLENRYVSFDENIEELRNNFTYKYDDIYTADDDLIYSKININKSLHNIIDRRRIVRRNEGSRILREILRPRRRFKREEDSERCETFYYQKGRTQISHPYSKNDTNKLYYGDIDCTTTIEGPEGSVIKLTFVDIFHIEDHPECAYDFLESHSEMWLAEEVNEELVSEFYFLGRLAAIVQ
ncbi:PREDICTED: uncharacterized protein LOC106116113 [Papilio xuthus]|uniref:Uncharacterized protein LOC106116113 n=1 Tax=Papilio xuthus TaxID=66420 RepID=A0AAJ6Z4V1_PAPXU|nr:PREDICTED: uncharacterized protein LOC106116113 [Papilio xuthus]